MAESQSDYVRTSGQLQTCRPTKQVVYFFFFGGLFQTVTCSLSFSEVPHCTSSFLSVVSEFPDHHVSTRVPPIRFRQQRHYLTLRVVTLVGPAVAKVPPFNQSVPITGRGSITKIGTRQGRQTIYGGRRSQGLELVSCNAPPQHLGPAPAQDERRRDQIRLRITI